MSLIHDLSWKERGFWRKFRLFLVSRKQESGKILHPHEAGCRIEGLSALASTYHSIAGSAAAELKSILRGNVVLTIPRLIIYFFSWFPLGAFCFSRSLSLSNKTMEGEVGYDHLSAEQCDIRQSILRAHKKWEEAERCIRQGMNKPINQKPHTFALLCIGMADVCKHQPEEGSALHASGWLDQAILVAKQIRDKEPLQAIRIFGKAAQLKRWFDGENSDSRLWEAEAQRLIEETNANDQANKLHP